MADPDLILSRERIDAVLLDLDGVVTDTTDLQARAWKRLFDTWLREHPSAPGEDHSPFDATRDYRRYIDGRPRDKGVKHFLLARGVELPDGAPDDGPEQDSIQGLGRRKNAMFLELLEEHGVEVYGCAVALLRRLRRAGIRTAAVTASRNCDAILDRAGVGHLFDARVDGNDAEREDLAGKPDPDTLLEAARRVGAEPARTAVLDDTVAGVRAAVRGRFGLIIGVDRGGQREALSEHGAHLVFDDPCHIGVAEPADAIPPLLEDPAATAVSIAERRPVLFLDYDNILTAPADDGDGAAARLDTALRPVLHQLALAIPVIILSDRDLDDLRRRVGLPRVVYAGSHGLEIQGLELRLELPEALDARADLAAAADALERRLAAVSGARVERRHFAVAVLGGTAPGTDPARLADIVDAVAGEHPRLRRCGAGGRLALRPDIDWDEGHAVRWVLAELGRNGGDSLPVFIGGSEADEDAFRELRRDGIGILATDMPRPSAAHYRLGDRARVEVLLQALAARL
jgi:alpha,alpha-trehalase